SETAHRDPCGTSKRCSKRLHPHGRQHSSGNPQIEGMEKMIYLLAATVAVILVMHSWTVHILRSALHEGEQNRIRSDMAWMSLLQAEQRRARERMGDYDEMIRHLLNRI